MVDDAGQPEGHDSGVRDAANTNSDIVAAPPSTEAVASQAALSGSNTPPTPDPQELQVVLKEILVKMNEFVSPPNLSRGLAEEEEEFASSFLLRRPNHTPLFSRLSLPS